MNLAIITPCYNAGDLILHTVESVSREASRLREEFPDWDVLHVIINDHSDDETTLEHLQCLKGQIHCRVPSDKVLVRRLTENFRQSRSETQSDVTGCLRGPKTKRRLNRDLVHPRKTRPSLLSKPVFSTPTASASAPMIKNTASFM